MKKFGLPSGQLEIDLGQHSEAEFDGLLAIGQRQNPKRGFLLVSKVLGKHLATRPHQMLESYRALAAQIPISPQTTTFIGMAETATALGQGVFEAAAQNLPALFLSTTRYPQAEQSVTIEEAHSHAPSHYLHLSQPAQIHFQATKRLILIDDEISTGQTLLGLAKAFYRYAPQLEQVFLVSLTDFLGTKRQTVLRQFPVHTQSLSLFKADLQFTPNPNWMAKLPPQTISPDHHAPPSPVRLGTQALGFAVPRIETIARAIAPQYDRVQVLGTGEYQFEPFLLALALEQLGVEVWFRATTRSPILKYGVIHDRLRCGDPYGQALEHYLYNNADLAAMPSIACAETAATDYLPKSFGKVRYLHLRGAL